MLSLFLLLALFKAATILLKPDAISMSSALQNSQICFEIHSSAKGYFALGIGSETMRGADIYAIWLNSSAVANVYRLEGTGHHHPPARTIQDIAVVKPTTKPDWAHLSAKFCRDLATSVGNPISPDTKYIYAWHDRKPKGDIDTASARIKNHHGNYGSFQFDFTKPSSSEAVENSTPRDIDDKRQKFLNMAFWHAILMFTAWVPAPIFGIFIARYMKKRLNKSWYHIHLAVMGLITGIGCIIGLYLIYTVRRKHFQSTTLIGDIHYKLGLVITIVMVAVQIPLGFLADYYYDPNRKSVPLLDKSHRIVGMLLVLFSVFNVWLGIKISLKKELGFAIPIQILFFAILALGIGLFGFSEVYLNPKAVNEQDESEVEALVAMDEE